MGEEEEMKGVEREISVARRIVIGVGVGGTECGETILRGRRAKGHVVGEEVEDRIVGHRCRHL